MKEQKASIQELSNVLEHQQEQLADKEMAISNLEAKLDKVSDIIEHLDVEIFQDESGDYQSHSTRNEKETQNHGGMFKEKLRHENKIKKSDQLVQAESMEKSSFRERRLQLPVPTQGPKMNVAFHATISQDIKAFLTHGQKIIFDLVNLNIGGYFEKTTGIFTAPINGLYLFSVTITSYESNNKVFLTRNGFPYGQIEVHPSSIDSSQYDQASLTAAMQLNAGDLISVIHSSTYQLVTYVGGQQSSFTGVLISQV
ncbi:hypothetical protein ACF0H5_000006 [Mactra antiquata]